MAAILPVNPKITALQQSFSTSVLTRIEHAKLHQAGVELWLKRDDLLHPVISGNKWRKLKYILNDVLTAGYDTVISMGGAYSNHLHALAYAGSELGIKTVGLVRGERPEPLNPTLDDVRKWGMALHFVSRGRYRELRQYRRHDALPRLQAGEYWLPEGGALNLALEGVAELVEEITIPYDMLCTACGTGTTLAGLVKASPKQSHVLGVAGLKNAEYLHAEVAAMVGGHLDNWTINFDYHGGGFAKINNDLWDFINSFKQETNIDLDGIYTGKLLFALFDLLGKGYFQRGQRIIALHTGGLQGNRSLAARLSG
ncbi:MAG: 1-aminocyclopropane-1-carboxylate deaminase [Methylobacter sp.]|nr:MAG: 1-aminocyclopropane-1-carboxylate deaminase [Methylobacter sp.]